MKRHLTLIIAFFLMLTIQSQEKELTFNNVKNKVKGDKIAEKGVEVNKEAIEASGALINFLMKYDKETTEGEVNQTDFDNMLKDMNWSTSETSNNGLTKEDAFKFMNVYIRSDKGETLQIDEQKKGEVVNFLNKIETGKSDALAILKEATTDVKLNQMMANAEKELYDAGIGRNSTWISYEEYKVLVKKEYPKATEGQIKAAYNYFLDQIKRGNGIRN